MDRSKKQPIFENIPMQSGELSQDAFFHPKEVKAQADFTRKIISSKNDRCFAFAGRSMALL